MNRRNVLIGLGGLVAGGGALLGTGAFTTVEAERTVSVETAGDADAFLGLAPADGEDDEGYVTVNDDGLIEINFDADAGDEAGEGLNQRARTTFLELVTITNQGTQEVDEISLEIEHDGGENIDGVFSYPINGDDEQVVEDGSNILGGDGAEGDLSPGDEVTFGLIVDLLDNAAEREELPEDGDYILTITAEAEDN